MFFSYFFVKQKKKGFLFDKCRTTMLENDMCEFLSQRISFPSHRYKRPLWIPKDNSIQFSFDLN